MFKFEFKLTILLVFYYSSHLFFVPFFFFLPSFGLFIMIPFYWYLFHIFPGWCSVTFLDYSYTCLRSFGIVPQLLDALFCFLSLPPLLCVCVSVLVISIDFRFTDSFLSYVESTDEPIKSSLYLSSCVFNFYHFLFL